ncbi:hypothetical protein ASE42_13285 [Bacillus sp. Root920]|uniref:YbaK/EbsC family protein n=1 Tax=Bacillus sp. Root920 TaxID=1736608 RepID=UPI0006FEDBFA|nr:YbaK/EbsC family protein [Bacillus sp. Root920]KRE14001.1 hypothetical protein ASE42_13285 [Bacillus sp. Root920]
MSIKQVKDYFKQYDMDTRIQEFSVSSATVDLAASALGSEPERIAKTLSFLVKGQAILIVTSGDAKVDNKKFYPACGSSNSAIELTIKQLEKHSGYSQWIDVCKGWNDSLTH